MGPSVRPYREGTPGMLCYGTLWRGMLCYVILWYVLLRYVMLCYVISLVSIFFLFHCLVLLSYFLFWHNDFFIFNLSISPYHANYLTLFISVEDMAERCIAQSWLDRQHFHKTNPFRGQPYRGWIHLHTFCYVSTYEGCKCNASLDVRYVLCCILQYWIGCGCLYYGTC